jgi:putative N6-adenine-specific DNA methylase
MTTFDLQIPCAIGLEKVLGNELRKLEIQILDNAPGRYRVRCTGPEVYRMLRSLRVAERVFWEFAAFKATTFDQFYQGVREARWPEVFPVSAKVHFDKVRVYRCGLSAISTLQSMAQKAVYDSLTKFYRLDRLPESGSETLVRIFGEADYFRICVDLSGEALHKRGYRVKSGRAPLKETIAAGILLLNGWKRKTPLYDPFCGSGTFLFEALAYAGNLAPNLFRSMGIANLKVYDQTIDETIIDALSQAVRFDTVVRLRGSDREPAMLALCRQNIAAFYENYRLSAIGQAWAAASLKLWQADMAAARREEPDGLLVANPPYGERLATPEAVRELNRSMKHLRTEFPDWAYACITTSADLAEAIGESAIWRRPIHNGASEAFVYRFDPLNKA